MKKGLIDMKVTVEIGGEQLEKLVQDGIDSMDKETVRDIARQSLREVFKNQEVAESLEQ